MLVTVPPCRGHSIGKYKGIVFGEAVTGMDFVQDFAAGLTGFFGGRSGSHEGEMTAAGIAVVI